MALRSQIRLQREGLFYAMIVAAVLAGAIARQLNLLMLVGSLLAAPFLFALLYGWVALRRIRVERRLPARLRADERLVVDISATNRGKLQNAWGVEVADEVSRDAAPGEQSRTAVKVFFPMISARESRQAAYQGKLPRRGRYQFGPIRVSTRFPMGLFHHSIVLHQQESLLVHPKFGRLTRDWAQMARENPLGGQRMQRRGLLETDFYGIRDWRTGDSRRRIHWRTSARRGSLVVREFEQRRSQDLALLVDLWQPCDPSSEQLENVETAISYVATLIADACRHPGRQVTLVLAGQEELFRSGRAEPMFLREQMDALALVAPHHDDSLPPLLGQSLAMIGASTASLAISTREIDLAALRAAAAERDAQLEGRVLRAINVSNAELSQYFTP